MTTQHEIRYLPVAALRPAEVNARFNVGDVSELAISIEQLGVLVPLLVTPRGASYLVVAGHRRLKACQSLGITEVPALVREMTELERLEMMLVENQQRVMLSPIEEGISYARILKQHPEITQKELAKHIGKSDWYVSTRVNILRLPKHVVDQIHHGELSVTAALGYTDANRKKHGRTRAYIRGAEKSPCKIERHAGHASDCEIRQMAYEPR